MMNFLLDTNVISEGGKPKPEPSVMDWLASVDEEKLFLSIISLAELRHGVERLKNGRRKSVLNLWLTETLPARFSSRLLCIDVGIANQWGHIVMEAQTAGRPIGAMDELLAG